MLGPIIADVNGLTLSDSDKEVLIHPLIGGVILFSRNYANPTQLQELIRSIKTLPRLQPLSISVDHEGGRVQRFRQHFSAIPPMGSLGELYDRKPVAATKQAFQLGWLLAVELLVSGVDYSYAPVLDLHYGVSDVIGDRAFHSHPLAVIELTQAFTDGMHAAGMPTTGKHFPGHGAVAADSHVAVPVDHRLFDEIWQNDLLPYRGLIQGGHLDAIMTAHIIYDAIDLNTPCFSPFWLQQILRQRLEFEGVIISDDLTMVGASTVGNYAQRAELALQAGCDMLLICNNRQAVLDAVEHLTAINYTQDPISTQRIKKLYGNCKINKQDLSAHADWHAAQALLTQTSDI